MEPVLVVDDELHIRVVISRLVESFGYLAHQAPDADTALSMMDDERISVAVCDVRMPGHDGLWLANEIRGRYPETAVILATGADDGRMAKRGRDLGALDYLVKPFGGDRLAGALRRAIDWHREAVATREWIDRLRTEQLDRRSRLERLLHRREAATPEPDSRLQEFGLSKKSAWGSGQLNQFAEWRRTVDPNGFTAAERVMRLAVATASRLGLGTREIDALRGAALLHDVGLMTMPPALMEKPAGFTTEERALVQQHPVIAFKMLEAHPALADVATVILSAYEAYSGKGYPQGLSREEIPLTSRILAVAIAYHAMMASRPHRPALQSSDALLELCRCQTSQFDPTVVAAFVRMLTEH